MATFSLAPRDVLMLRPLVKARIEQLGQANELADEASAELSYLIALERAFAKAAETEDAA